VKRKSTKWPSGVWFVAQKTKGGYLFKTLRSKYIPSWEMALQIVNGRWGLANTSSTKICWLESFIPGFLET
jgi:hypothetical protein